MKKINRWFVFLVSCIMAQSVHAQEMNADGMGKSPFSVAVEYDYLYSTHKTKFQGPGINGQYRLNKRWDVGIGTAYIHCPLHNDNGLILTHLKFVPVFAFAKYHIPVKSAVWEPYGTLRIGVTFAHYDREDPSISIESKPYSERGFYTYAGVGTNIRLCKKVKLFVDGGLVGYKMSFNDLDINPHGVMGKSGLLFNL